MHITVAISIYRSGIRDVNPSCSIGLILARSVAMSFIELMPMLCGYFGFNAYLGWIFPRR